MTRSMVSRRLARPSVLIALTAALLSACEPGRPASLVDDLRFIAASVDPPEVIPGEEVTIDWEIADPGQPAGRELEYFFLPCSGFTGVGVCLEFSDLVVFNPEYLNEDGTITEEGYVAYLERYAQRGITPAGTLTIRFDTAFSLVYALSDPSQPPQEPVEGEIPLVPQLDGRAWLLVCAPGLCDSMLADVDALLAGEVSVRTATEVVQSLTSADYLAEVSMDGSALAAMRYAMTLREEGDPNRNLNPTLGEVLLDGVEAGPSITVRSGAQVGLAVVLEEEDLQQYTRFNEEGNLVSDRETATVRFFSTDGEFRPTDVYLEAIDGPVASSFTAPEVAFETEVRMWVTMEDDRYGSSWVERMVTVVP